MGTLRRKLLAFDKSTGPTQRILPSMARLYYVRELSQRCATGTAVEDRKARACDL
jgi:hypothetical protein